MHHSRSELKAGTSGLDIEYPYHHGATLLAENQFESAYRQLLQASKAWRALNWLHPITAANLYQATALGEIGANYRSTPTG
jgi:hypothetical protein